MGRGGPENTAGAGTGPIEKWSRTPGWGEAGPSPEKTAGGRHGPHRKVVQNAYSVYYSRIKQAFFACVYMSGFDHVYRFIKANSNVFLSEPIIKRDNI